MRLDMDGVNVHKKAMTVRLCTCLILSALIHVLVFLQPWQFLGSTPEVDEQDQSISVGLVDDYQEEEIQEQPDPVEEVPIEEEGVSFEVEGVVNADYLELLKMKIFNVWEYPEDARVGGYDGQVRIAFVLDDDGRLIDRGIVSSSGYYPLDLAAMGAIEKATPFGPFPQDITTATLKITAKFCYILD